MSEPFGFRLKTDAWYQRTWRPSSLFGGRGSISFSTVWIFPPPRVREFYRARHQGAFGVWYDWCVTDPYPMRVIRVGPIEVLWYLTQWDGYDAAMRRTHTNAREA